jgi:preprotein translocase subunit SecA
VRAFRDRDEKWNAVVESICEIHETGRPILVGTRNVEASEQLSQRLLEVGLVCQVLNAARLAEEALVIAKAGEAGKITIATNMAGRGTDIVIDRDVVDKGGLHVMATEAHESSRIDRQLFGRAGRQGDPGSSQLFFSLEDELVQNHLSVRERQWLPMGKALRKAQTRAQRQAYQKRRRVLQMDDWLDNALSFASS